MQNGGVFTVSTLMISKDRRTPMAEENMETAQDSQEAFETPFLRIKFEDTGVGVKKEDLDKMFEPFFTTKPEDKGTGLGLSVCYTIVQKHSGFLEVESEWGKGAAFIVDLPITEAAANPISDILVEEAS